ncbi:SDR family NAD(P)-dependent oxidoreductase [Gottfriedia solisilvae]|uniref:SDR family NAD(P)-dependent oxidoreductase n=1 Tax=Gottfriedia solisilvae TaxID=1516104 RepID=UPI003D2EB400
MDLAIVTGASKGLGYEISKAFLQSSFEVIGLSRSMNSNMNNFKKTQNNVYSHIQIDLCDIKEIEVKFKGIVQKIITKQPKKVYVINNAGMVDPIERVGYLEAAIIEKAVQLNYLTPMLINNLLLKELIDYEIEIIIVNVTSGAAEHPIHGWSVYNSTKAAINMYTKVAGLELESNMDSKNKMIGFNPGVMDTYMQYVIRRSKQDAFAEINKFLDYKKNNELRSPEVVSNALLNLLFQTELKNGRIYSIKELL